MTDLIVNGDAEQGLTGWLTVAGAPVVLQYDTGRGIRCPVIPVRHSAVPRSSAAATQLRALCDRA